jgi:uncharacterized protein (DUF779 family)
MIKRVLVSAEAMTLIDSLRKENGPLMFHQSGGCCDGSSPMCFTDGEFQVSEQDVYLGEVHDCPFYMSKNQFEYWKHTQLTLDITKGRGASFSLEIPTGYRFVIKSRLFSDEEYKQLETVRFGNAQ